MWFRAVAEIWARIYIIPLFSMHCNYQPSVIKYIYVALGR